MTTKPVVSVLMPVYNSAKFVRAAVNSILSQTLSSLELIVIDDGSTDGSLRILKELASRDSRIRVHSRPNRGVIQTRNELLAHANAELIAWADSDDISEPDRLQLQVASLSRDPDLVSVGAGLLLIDPCGRPISRQSFPPRLEIDQHLQSPRTDTPFCASMMRTKTVRDVGGFRAPFRIGEDFDLFLRLIEVGRIENLPNTLVRYRQHPSSISAPSQLGRAWSSYFRIIMDLAMERRTQGVDRIQRGEAIDPPEHSEHATSEGISEATLYAIWARQARSNGFRKSALAHAAIAICREPLSPIGWKALAHVTIRQLIR